MQSVKVLTDPHLNSGQLLAELHAKVHAEKLGWGAMLQQIVETARILTGAHGAAIAMRQDDSFLCIARAGNMAPPIGSQLDLDSGISGQCLRTGAPLRCDDTDTDPRVDREVCRRLELRALAVAPIGKGQAVSGVLEVFSSAAHAFDDSEVQLIAELAGLVDFTTSTADLPADFTACGEAGTPGEHCEHQRNCLMGRECPGLKLARVTRKWSNFNRMSKGKLAVAAVAFVLVIGLGLRVIGTHPNLSAAAPLPRSTTTPGAPTSGPGAPTVGPGPSTVAEEPSPPPENSLRPSPAVPENTKAISTEGVSKADSTGKAGASDPVIAEEPQPKAAAVANPAPLDRDLTSPPPPKAVVDTAPPVSPTIVASADAKAELRGVLSGISVSPVLRSAEPSGPITGGALEREVKPIYPQAALRLKRSGRVILQALITKQGSVKVVKVIEGDSLLARAAMDAVVQWHYQPYELDGQPIQRTTEITIVFKLP